ncbi:MAG TPA: hypothetical protein DEG43_12640 [Acidimicrobiaceae bacterium]|jgi:uncharacterized OB-fold protein|nr:hypothetical protein [Acidimicrobiaceae bacterium]
MGEPLELLSAPLVIEYPFNRTTGPVIGAFLTGLRDQRVVGIEGDDRRVVCPPVEYDPHTGSPLTDLVAVGTEGVVQTWAWVETVREGQPLQQPHALALILLDGADTAMLHVVDCGSPDALSTGDRVRIRWAEERSGSICDIECFERVGGEQ